MGGMIGDWLSPPSPLHSPFPSWGTIFQTIVAVDALLVLSGSVLTAYVGIGGLISRLAMDRCFPSVVLRTNVCRGTYTVSIWSFFLIAASLILVLDDSVEALAGVYALSFLAVMALFAIGIMLLKVLQCPLPHFFFSLCFLHIFVQHAKFRNN
ncbi:amino acid-polyamine-organocation family [Nannochloropsis gaditana]|uniref:Amino acid-polyamine-organocation family n=1 Tax=Nannochloropsis gaditana TaxID=72520 RepID=W7T6S4_9STRA|nr:amino acid-polyamine-organocation family [Nannochloropsis gaditana]